MELTFQILTFTFRLRTTWTQWKFAETSRLGSASQTASREQGREEREGAGAHAPYNIASFIIRKVAEVQGCPLDGFLYY